MRSSAPTRAPSPFAGLAACLIALAAAPAAQAQGGAPCSGEALALRVRSAPDGAGTAVVVDPGGSLAFEVTGGACPVSLGIASNGSGARFDAATATYLAGSSVASTGAVDVVMAVDASGAVASVNVTVVVRPAATPTPGSGGFVGVVGPDGHAACACGGSGDGVAWVAAFGMLRARRGGSGRATTTSGMDLRRAPHPRGAPSGPEPVCGSRPTIPPCRRT